MAINPPHFEILALTAVHACRSIRRRSETTVELIERWEQGQERGAERNCGEILVTNQVIGYRKVRYRGIDKNSAQVFTLLALANLFLARRQLRCA